MTSSGAHSARTPARPTRNSQSPRRRRASARVRRRRALAGLFGLGVLAIVLIVVLQGGGSASVRGNGTTSIPTGQGSNTTSQHSPKADPPIPAVEAGLLPWSLAAPVSREVVLPGSGSSVTVVGGLSASQQSLSDVFTLDTSSGAATAKASLPVAVHDAAGVLLGQTGWVFGGGSPLTFATNQELPPSAHPRQAAPLPSPRSDATAVTLGGVAYIVGGYDGSTQAGGGDAKVLATTDGHSYSPVATLPVPVRYPAVAALGGHIYVFGGELAGGQAVDTIQRVDPAAKTATVIGHLAKPLSGAAAFVVGGSIYIAGGQDGSGHALAAVWAFNPDNSAVLRAGTLPVAVSHAGATVSGGRAWLVGGEAGSSVLASVEMVVQNTRFGTAGAPGAGSPFFGGRLLVADRGNDRLLLLDPNNQVVWTYPSLYAAAPPGGFYFPDDAFFAAHGTEIISNQEKNQTVVIIAFPSGKVLWQYGHPRTVGDTPGYLNTPDDAYILPDGVITVADAYNCRVLFIRPDKTLAKQIGTTRACMHQPPNYLGSPNGDTPLANGNVLISEINGSWVSEYTRTGRKVWSVQLPLSYPSDPQQLGPDLYLIADYANPGGIVEFTRSGKIVYRYYVSSGPGELGHPSLVELLPSGVFMANDDYRDRMVAIDPATKSLVWQYGVTDTPGTAAGQLNTPDGFDLLLPNGTTPTHRATL